MPALLRRVVLLVSTYPAGVMAQAVPGKPVTDTLHGVAIADPFRGLEDVADSAVQRWVRSQDRAARDYARGAPRYSELRASVDRIANATVYSPPQRRGDREFYSTFSASGPAAAIEVHVRDAGRRGLGRPLVRLDDVRRTHAAVPLTFQPSPDGRRLLVGMAANGTSWLTLRVLDVETGQWRSDSVPDFYRPLAAVTWHPSGEGFFYSSFARAGQRGAGDVRYFALGSGESRLVFRADSAANRVTAHGAAPHGRYLVLLTTNSNSRETAVTTLDLKSPGATPQPLHLPRGTYTLAGEWRDTVFLTSTAAAPRGKVIAVDPHSGNTRTVIPEGDAAVSTWPGVGANVVGGRVLMAYARDSRLDVRLYSTSGAQLRAVRLPRLGSVWSGFVGTPSSSRVFYQVQGLADPGTVYRLDLDSGASTADLTPVLAYDPGDLVTERIVVPVRDGAEVPVHIVRRRDVAIDGRAPLVMYGYGFGGWIAAPWFQPMMASWVTRGGIWALAGVRGGGEYGVEWQRAGARRNKQVGIDDYVAVTEWLIANRYTSADRMIANASSAGGPLVAAATLQRPALFRAVIYDYSLFDMVRYHRFGHSTAWQSEYGVSTDSADFEVLRTYSSLHSVKAGVCYPASLAVPGELDQTAPAFHSYKFIAALRRNAGTCPAAHHLRVTWGAGHSAGATPADAAETWADELGFLQRVLGTLFPAR